MTSRKGIVDDPMTALDVPLDRVWSYQLGSNGFAAYIRASDGLKLTISPTGKDVQVEIWNSGSIVHCFLCAPNFSVSRYLKVAMGAIVVLEAPYGDWGDEDDLEVAVKRFKETGSDEDWQIIARAMADSAIGDGGDDPWTPPPGDGLVMSIEMADSAIGKGGDDD
uniref:Uncharacterized protein n=1 Tax=viral metagenome TaxID=1070528 RepID=A0A6M3X5T4_9ZZZZ